MTGKVRTGDGGPAVHRSTLTVHTSGAMGMAIAFEAYTVEGILRGTAVPDGRLGDLLETFASVTLDSPVITPLDGRPDRQLDRADVAIDDLLAVVAPSSTPAPVHATWHELALVAGPYLIEGKLPTLPGFDPSRALARPAGTFVLIDSARVSLAGKPSSGTAAHPFVWVNRYTVEQVQADLELGIFFPGARTVHAGRSGYPGPVLLGASTPTSST